MKSIQVSDETHDKLMRLKGIKILKSIDDLIAVLIFLSGYDRLFWERIDKLEKGLVVDE